MKINKKYTLLVASLLIPIVSYAETLGGLKELIKSMGQVINLTIPVVFALTLVYFFWGLAQFILKDAGNEKTREDGKKKIIWSIVALFIFISIAGIMNLVSNIVGVPVNTSYFGQSAPDILPSRNFSGGYTGPNVSPNPPSYDSGGGNSFPGIQKI